MRPTFDHTVSVLVKAFLNDELAHKTCSACAVGNIVADAIGTKPKKTPLDNPIEFDNNFFENGQPAQGGWYQVMNGGHSEEGVSQIRATGYTIEEICAIERAFEYAKGDPDQNIGLFRGRCVDPTWMFNGLMAVVDVLAEIHEVDLSQKESAKQLFVK